MAKAKMSVSKKRASGVAKDSIPESIVPYSVGESLLIRTVTHAWVGRVLSVFPGEIVLYPAAWVADTGRYSNAVEKGLESESSSEIEVVVGKVTINRSSIVDAVRYKHDLPKDTK